MASKNDTNTARVIAGDTGSGSRLETSTGSLGYSNKHVTRRQQEYVKNMQHDVNYRDGLRFDGGVSRTMALKLGLPPHVRADPLGCGCDEAHLVGATKPVGSHIEADYMCDSGYHNYMLFELIGFEQKPETQLKIGVNGELVEDVDEETKELGDF